MKSYDKNSRRDDSYLVDKLNPSEGTSVDLPGEIESCRVVNSASGWGFGRLWVKQAKIEVPFIGLVGDCYGGQRVTLRGRWKEHERFGWQIDASAIILELPEDHLGTRVWLEENFPDIGPVRAGALVNTFPPPSLWDVIEQTPKRLQEVEGIGPVLANAIVATYHRVKAERELYVGLADWGLKAQQVRDAAERWGRKALEKLQKNPYRLLEVDVPWKQVDGLARQHGVSIKDPRRIVAGHIYAMQLIENDGHTLASSKVVQSKVSSADVLNLSLREVLPHLKDVFEAGQLTEVMSGYVSLTQRAKQEMQIAAFIHTACDIERQHAWPTKLG